MTLMLKLQIQVIVERVKEVVYTIIDQNDFNIFIKYIFKFY